MVEKMIYYNTKHDMRTIEIAAAIAKNVFVDCMIVESRLIRWRLKLFLVTLHVDIAINEPEQEFT